MGCDALNANVYFHSLTSYFIYSISQFELVEF